MKLPFTFAIKFVFRILLPGFVLASGLLPVTRTLLVFTDNFISLEYAFALEVLILGWLFVVLDMPIYMAFEGRRFWPLFLRSYFERRERKRLESLRMVIAHYRDSDDRKYREASVEIRRFPLDKDGDYEVRFPTRLGNLLTAYEEYSRRVYGMYQGLYWPRIWLRLDKDQREEIDGQQALADSTLYSVAALYINGLLLSAYAVMHAFELSYVRYLPHPPFHWILPVSCFVSGYLIYRLALHVHATFGETFKAVFDQFGQDVMFPKIVEGIANLSCEQELKAASVEEQNMAVWRYLHNNRVKCNICGKVMRPTLIREHKRSVHGEEDCT